MARRDLESVLDRREFIALAGVTGASLYLATPRRLLAAGGPGVPKFSFSWDVRRREDFLSLRFHFYNLELKSTAAGPVLKRTSTSQPSAIVVELAPQNVAEEAFLELAPEFEPVNPETPAAPGDVRSRVAQSSRLAFAVGGNPAIPFTYAGLLDWMTGLTPLLAPLARTTKPALGSDLALRAPRDFETAIELPWRLLLSPNEKSAWAHSTTPVTSTSGRTELWHSRLGVKPVFPRLDGKPADGVDEGSAGDRTMRAIWTRDWDTDPSKSTGPVGGDHSVPPDLFRMSLDPTDRSGIVRATSDYGIKAGCFDAYDPQPVRVNRLLLTALGAWVDLDGVWDLPDGNSAQINLEAWRHRATAGRDTFVRVIERGRLLPFRHRASVVKVTERKLHDVPGAPAGQKAAYLRQRFFVVVRETVVNYGPDVVGQPHDGRAFPFDRVEIRSLVTPPLLDPVDTYLGATDVNAPELPPMTPVVAESEAWVPHLGPAELFRFQLVVTDKDGDERELTMPLVFVADNAAFSDAKIEKIVERYDDPALDDAVRHGDLQGQAVSLAPSQTPGDTSVEVSTMTFGAELTGGGVPLPCLPPKLRFWPTLATANVRLAGASQAAGKELTTDIQLAPGYVDDGFTAGEVFAKVATTTLGFDTNRSGGVLQPSFDVKGLSRSLGPVGAESFGGSTYDVGALLPNATLLGGIKLKDIVVPPALPAVGMAPGDDLLRLTYETTTTQLLTRLHWVPELDTDTSSTKQLFEKTSDSSLVLDARVATSREHPEDSTIEVHGDLRGFKLNLIGLDEDDPARFLILHVNRFSFDTKEGRTTFDVDIREVLFAGVLQFVNELRNLLNVGGGTGAGPSIDVTPTAVTAGFGVEVPPLEVGVFALSNLRLAASVSIPFSGKPVSVRFAVADREDPFVLQVSFFAGGGFFALAVNGDGVEQVEAALEFGARCALDIGVASGSVELMAGIYFGYGQDLDSGVVTAILEGYVRLRGELCVIEIVEMSLTFELSLRYQNIGGFDKVVGRAEMTVTIEVLVFSGDVTLTVERRFGSGPQDPTFAQQLPEPSLWESYAKAFAEVPA
jgi:hypothetical protein